MLFQKYDLVHSSVWCPALACHCQLDYVPLKIHMLKFYLPVPWLCSYLEIVFTEVARRLVFIEVKTILEWAPIR